jgi:outer membrane biosynthesis protein TonB
LKNYQKLELQTFAEGEGEDTNITVEELNALTDVEEPKPETKVEEQPKVETKVEPNEVETKEETKSDDKKPGSKELRESYEKEKQARAEIEKKAKDLETRNEKLAKAIEKGITGKNIDEILANYDAALIKEEATRGGLTEAQVIKEKELKEKMNSLSEKEKELTFNQRAYS